MIRKKKGAIYPHQSIKRDGNPRVKQVASPPLERLVASEQCLLKQIGLLGYELPVPVHPTLSGPIVGQYRCVFDVLRWSRG